MRIIRYQDSAGAIHYGAHDAPSGRAVRIDGDILGAYRVSGEPADVRKLLAPVVVSAILCIGLNYREHAAESGADEPKFPVLFMKMPNALQNPGDPIVLPRHLRSDKVDYEGELCVVIGKTCRNVGRDRALDYVLGYTCANDVSARDWQRDFGGGQFSRGKSFDTFAPIGPCIVTPDELGDARSLQVRTFIGDEMMQDGSTADMIFDVARLVEFLSGSTTLPAGSVILTGTPPGVGMARKPPRWLAEGDQVTVEITGIGRLTNPVTAEK